VEVEDRVVVLGVVRLGPHLAHRAQPEGLDPVLDHHGYLAHASIMPGVWQKIYGYCHSCHSWRIINQRRLTAMNTFTSLLVLVPLTAALLVALAYLGVHLARFVAGDGSVDLRGHLNRPAADLLPSSHLDPFPTHPTALLR
jgi:hypothetical protein